ncbi:MAG: fused response regulator/phosphatase [Paenibacillaceae bacterium]|nr:fused response regulator/phosphatase [Paenibacillaceae bacterium]
MRIMIVDDNPVNLIVIEKILHNAGYRNCVKMASAKEMFEHMLADKPLPGYEPVDLILLDMMMPEIDGIEATRRIMRTEKLKDIPVIIVTALGDSAKLAEALDAGATDYVIKPINKTELLARIRSALRLKSELDWHKDREKKVQEELELARQVQRSVLSDPVDTAKLRIRASYAPSSELAGDMYAWFAIDEHRYGVIVLDMMGHGISSSLVCMFIASVMQDAITRRVDPENVMRELNRYMHRLYNREQFLHYYFTAIYMVIDTEQRTIDYVNAGHPPGLLVYDSGKVERLASSTCAIGFFETIEVTKHTVAYDEPLRIVMYTDGLQEMIAGDEEEALAILTDVVVREREADPTALLDMLVPENSRERQHDDMCLVVIGTKEGANGDENPH